jgi:DNA-binding LacI/PurR family transcriptional regulator
VISHIFNSYARLLLRGIQDEVDRQNTLRPGLCRLVIFKGNILRTPFNNMARENIVYHSLPSAHLDGLIVPANVFSTHMPVEDLLPIVKSWGVAHTLATGLVLPGYPSVVMDPGGRMEALVTHLIEKHGCRRLAFLSGPEGNADAELRLEAFRKVLAEHNLEFPPEHLLPGDFSFYNTRAVLEERFRGRKPTFDALVCANDEMAIEALKFFQRNGQRIPQDLAVTGLDDIDQATLVLPQLTTIREPVAEMGARAVQELLTLLEHPQSGTEATIHRIPTSLKLRSSCGCLARLESHTGEAPVPLTVKFDASMLEPGRKQEVFLLEFQRFIEDRIRAGDDTVLLQGHIFGFRTRVLREFADAITPRNITDLLAEMQKIVTSLSQMVYSVAQEGFEDLMRNMRAFVRMEQLLHWSDIERELGLWLPTLALDVFVLVVYPKPVDCPDEETWQFPPKAEVRFAWTQGGPLELTEAQRVFDPSRALLPEAVVTASGGSQWLVNVLSYAGRVYGYYVYDSAHLAALSSELLRVNLKNLLQNHMLLSQPGA